MAKTQRTGGKTDDGAPVGEDGFTIVTLAVPVEIAGHLYRPGLEHTVDAALLAAFGEAILTQRKAD